MIDQCLSVKDGHLFIEGCDTTELVEKYGSPLFVVSENQLRRNVREFKYAFSKYWPEGEVQILPAIKSNLTLATRHVLTEEGAGADVYSEGELYAALRGGVNPEMISVNGGGKTEKMIRRCIEEGVLITIEDIDEPDLINEVAKSLGKTAKVRFRVKPSFPNLWKMTDFGHEFASIDLGIQIYKSGIPAEYLEDLGKRVIAMSNVELTGLHFHGGRHHASLWYWEEMMKSYGKLIASLTKAWGNYRLETIDIGGGYAVSRDPHSKIDIKKEVLKSVMLRPTELVLKLFGDDFRYKVLSDIMEKGVVHEAATEKAPSVEAYAKAAAGTLREELMRQGMLLKGIKLQVEPGRSLYGNVGIHLSKVKKVKHQNVPLKLSWALIDTTQFFLNGGVMENNFHHYEVANKVDMPKDQVADVVGQSCYGDRILPFAKVPTLEEGDIIALLDTGAYQEVSASNFNALPRPGTVMVKDDGSDWIKLPEKVEDIFSRDQVPSRFAETQKAEYILNKLLEANVEDYQVNEGDVLNEDK